MDSRSKFVFGDNFVIVIVSLITYIILVKSHMDKFYITTPIYYASGPPHIGHALSTTIADVVARWKRKNGQEVFLATGVDEHGGKIAETARKNNQEPQDFVDKIVKQYDDAWKVLGIEYSGFTRTTSKKHKQSVLAFLGKLRAAGDIYEGEYKGLYCVGCENFVLARNLVNGVCPDHLTSPSEIKEKSYFFNLKKYLPAIKNKIEKEEIKIIPTSRKNEILAMIESGLEDFSLTREKVEWGIPFPFDKGQVVYVWIDALINYLSVLDFPDGENFKKFWPPDLHLIGAEINKFHSIFWPALLMSANLPLPLNIFVHGLFTINGQKMSKTIGNILDPVALSTKFGADAVRYLLLSQFPAYEHGNIKADDFVGKYNSDLANGVGNILERSFTMMFNFRGGLINDRKNIDNGIKIFAAQEGENYENNFASYKLYEALGNAFSFIKKLDRYINEEHPWTLDKDKDEKLDIILSSLLFGIEKIIIWLEPFMPNKMREAKIYLDKLGRGEIKKGDKLGLFPRI